MPLLVKPPFMISLAIVTAGMRLFVTSTAQASSVLETIGAPGTGNGFTARVLSQGADVAYFNPALLPDASPSLSFGVLVLGQWSRIRLDHRPVNVDVPESVYDADLVRTQAGNMQFWPQPTSQLLHQRSDTRTNGLTTYAALGMVRPLVNDSRLVFGFYGLIPTTGFLHQDSFFSDEREQYFSNQLHSELLGDRLRVPTLVASLGGRIFKSLSWGVGVDIGMATRTQMQIYVPNAADQRTLLLVPKIDTTIAASPFVGIALQPWQRTWATLTVHAPKSWDTSGENRIRFWDYTYPSGETAVVQSYELTQGSEPLRIGLGLSQSGHLGSTEWRLGLEGLWTRWSRYRDRHGERPELGWQDTMNLGLGWVLERAQRRFIGELGVAPSPVPDQNGRSSYVDNTRWGTSLGIELPFSYLTTDYAVGAFLQAQFMLPRSTTKESTVGYPVKDEFPDGSVDRIKGTPLPGAAGLQTNNPGYPGYTSFGMMLGASLVLKVLR